MPWPRRSRRSWSGRDLHHGGPASPRRSGTSRPRRRDGLVLVRSLGRGRPRRRLGAVGAAARAAGRALPRRQLPARADGALRSDPHRTGPPAAHELVPNARARLAPVPALPEPALHDHRIDRHRLRPRHGVPVVLVPVARAVAALRVRRRPAVRPEPLDRRRGRRGGAVPRLGRRHRLRDQGLRLGGLRRVDPAVGLVDVAARLGLHLPRPVVAPRRPARRPPHHGDRGAALRDRVPGLRAARRVALHSCPRTCGGGWAAPPSWARPRWRRRPGSSCRCWTSPTGRRATRCSSARASRTATAPARC